MCQKIGHSFHSCLIFATHFVRLKIAHHFVRDKIKIKSFNKFQSHLQPLKTLNWPHFCMFGLLRRYNLYWSLICKGLIDLPKRNKSSLSLHSSLAALHRYATHRAAFTAFGFKVYSNERIEKILFGYHLVLSVNKTGWRSLSSVRNHGTTGTTVFRIEKLILDSFG